jgi:hypothetical protein
MINTGRDAGPDWNLVSQIPPQEYDTDGDEDDTPENASGTWLTWLTTHLLFLSGLPLKVLGDPRQSDRDQNHRPHSREAKRVGIHVVQQEQHTQNNQENRTSHSTVLLF